MRFTLWIGVFIATVGLASSRAQFPTLPPVAAPPPAKPEAMTLAEATILTNGWAHLAEGRIDLASQVVDQIRTGWPQSVHGLALAVEVEIARTDSGAALVAYERWLANRAVDEPFVLRRIARASLFEATRTPGPPGTRLSALRALATDGEEAARATLEQAAFSHPGTPQSLPEARVLAAMGDERAIAQIIDLLVTIVPGKVGLVDALAEGGNRRAIPGLVRLMEKDPEPANRAAAADGLGRLDAREAIPQLRALLEKPTSTIPERMAAGGALYRLGDLSGFGQLRNWLLSSPVPGMRVESARAMSSHPDTEWQGALREVLQGDDPNVLIAAAGLIAPYDPQLAKATIGRLMNDPNVVVREQASQVLARQLAGDFRTLRAMLHSADPGTRVAAGARILELTR